MNKKDQEKQRKKRALELAKIASKKRFAQFVNAITLVGYHKMTQSELESNVFQKQLQIQRKPKNIYNKSVMQFLFTCHDHSVKIITSVVHELTGLKANFSDEAKVLLLDKDGKTIFMMRLHRRKYFLLNLEAYALGFAQLLKALPVCNDKQCRNRMIIIPPTTDLWSGLPEVVCPNLLPHESAPPVDILDFITYNPAHTLLKLRMQKRKYYSKVRGKAHKSVGEGESRRIHWDAEKPVALS